MNLHLKAPIKQLLVEERACSKEIMHFTQLTSYAKASLWIKLSISKTERPGSDLLQELKMVTALFHHSLHLFI